MGILANSASVTMTSSSADDSKSGYIANERVTLSTNPGGANYAWAIAPPEDSAPTRSALTSVTAASPSFVPDVAGVYTLTCIVDAATTFVLQISVTLVVTISSTEAMRLLPLRDEQVAAPPLGLALYYSETIGGPAYKLPNDTVHALGIGGSGLLVGGSPSDGFVPTWQASSVSAIWEPSGGLSVTAFAATVTLYECGQSVANPAFTASYNLAPTTAVLTNNANGESKDVHLTPTSFTSSQTYQKNTPNQSVTWTLTTSNGTRNASATWGQRNYAGIVSAGASLATLVAAATFSSLGTSRSFSFTVTDDGTHKCQLALPARLGTPTVKDHSTGFGVALTLLGAFSLTNAQGFSESYNQYQFVTSFSGSFTGDVS